MKNSKGRWWLLGVLVLALVVSVTMLPSLNAQGRESDQLSSLKQKRIEAEIAEMRAEIKANGWTFTVGNNPAMQYELDQITGFNPMLARTLKYSVSAASQRTPQLSEMALPSSYISPYVTPIRNQGNCGSCWAFAGVAAFESAIYKKTGLAVDLSEQFLVSCNHDEYGCGGGWWAYDLFVNPGAELEACFPYVAQDVPCNLNCPYPYVALGSAFCEKSNAVASITSIKNAIYNYGGVSVALNADRTFQAYTGGVMNKCKNSRWTNHMVLLCGWDDAKGAWRMKNSWGTGWGESGFMWIKYSCNLVGYGASYVLY